MRIDQALEDLQEVPIQPGLESPSNFIELLPVWPDTLPDDYRLRVQTIEKWVGEINSRCDDLSKRCKDLGERLTPLEVLKRLKG